MKRIWLFAITCAGGAAGAALMLSGADAPARAQPGGANLQQCPERLVAGQSSLLCDCPSEATAGGSVWGSDLYTDDSAICRAALHAGMIGTDGGAVYVVEAPGQGAYPAVTRNSVASSSWPSWGRSIAFRPAGDAGKGDDQAMAACPDSATSLSAGARLGCGCSASATAAGSVWGSGPYTADSSVCRAALHAGAIGVRGGTVRLRMLPGEGGYAGSNRNGVSSNNWGSFSSSFDFER